MKVIFRYGKDNNEKALSQSVNIRVFHSSFDFRRSLKLDINKDGWDFENSTITDLLKGSRTFEESQYLQELKTKLNSVEQTFNNEFRTLKLSHRLNSLHNKTWNEWCEETLNKGLGIVYELPDEEPPLLLDKIQEYLVSQKEEEWSDNTIRSYASNIKILGQFMDFSLFAEANDFSKEDLSIWSDWYFEKYGKTRKKEYKTNEVDLVFYKNLREWNKLRGNGDNYFGALIKKIKVTIFHFRSVDSSFPFHVNIDHKNFKVLRTTPEYDILTPSELDLVFDYSGLPSLENVRDLAVISYYACLRYDELNSELSKGKERLKFNQTSKGMLWDLFQKKVKGAKGIPVHEKILSLYNSDKFPHLISNQKYNKYLKVLIEAVGIKKEISTHTLRRSFCCNMYNDKHDLQSIMQYSGHKLESTLMDYIPPKHRNRDNSIPTE